ncbi:hypothetical protein GLOIN_2v1778881 [Rhizophagus irregularis DAOM 181602=DAOM 197198]|nr:hypothetical protein GLOIN_2v1778881 [Rhizophagus irregularis DAOM 181602=DAOM 197198]
MVADQKYSSDISSEQEVIRRTEKLAQSLGLDEQNTRAYKALSGQIWALEKRLEDYHIKYVKLKRKVNLLEDELDDELDDLNECVDRGAVVDLIHEIVPSLISKKGLKGDVHKDSYYSFESSEDSDSVEYLPERDLKNARNINNIWEREVNLEWSKRMNFLFGRIVQGNYTVKEYYSKLKECNLSKDYPEWLFKNLFFRELSPEDILKVRLDGLQALALDDIVERLSPEHKMFDEDIDAEKEKAFDEFTKEYGQREEDWTIYDDWYDWDDLFCEIKTHWNTKAVKYWREKILKRFVYSLPSVSNPTSLFHVLLQSNVIYLPQIISLIELPYYPLELRSEIWGPARMVYIARYKACRGMWKFNQLSAKIIEKTKIWPILLSTAL